MVKTMKHAVQKLPVHGQWLSLLRHELQISYSALAEKIGVSGPVVSCYRTGAKRPSEAVWKAIAKLAKVSESEYWDGPPHRKVTR